MELKASSKPEGVSLALSVAELGWHDWKSPTETISLSDLKYQENGQTNKGKTVITGM